jgi:PPOX class probable F420-dependent enzyme
MSVEIPETHLDLLTEPIVAVLTTLMPDGSPQSTAVWRLWEDSHLLVVINTTMQKYRNVQRDPRVAVINLDFQNPERYIEMRGIVVDITPDPEIITLDRMSHSYTGKPYYGGILPFERKGILHHVVLKIEPLKITAR